MNKRSTLRARIPIPIWVRLLVGIKVFPDRNVTDLSEATKVSYTTAFRLISKFEEKKKWVKIQKDSFNTKENKIILTEKGKKICDGTIDWLRLQGFKPEHKSFIDSIKKSE